MFLDKLLASRKDGVEMSKKYQIIYADPPWSYKASGAPASARPSLRRGLKPHAVTHYYDTLSTDEICSLPVPSIFV